MLSSLFKGIVMIVKMINQFKELIEYREVFITLVIRDVNSRYKQTIVGIFWAVLQPLFMMVIFTVLFNRFTKFPSEGVPYPIFCLTALIPWGFFSTAINLATPSLYENVNLIRGFYFPRAVLPLSSICTAMIDFFVAVCLFILVLIFSQTKITFLIVFVIPLFIIQFIFTLGLILFVSAMHVFYRDVKFVIPFLMQIGMFATPIVYSAEMVSSKYKLIYMLNPMAGVIDGYRKVILLGVMPNYQFTLSAFLVSLLTLVVGYSYFKFVESSFADAL